MSEAIDSELVIGWKLNRQFEPQYWLDTEAAPGKHGSSDVVRAPAAAMANHMVIVAQSGSGKSFFLGRILEELLLKTRSRIVIFDPNSDFRRIGDVVAPKFWTQKASPKEKEGYGYDRDKRRGFLPDEISRDVFEEKWKAISKLVLSMLPGAGEYNQKLKIDWPNISVDILMDELDPTLQTEVKHCHNFVQMVSELIVLTKQDVEKTSQNFLDIAKDLCQATKGRTEQEVRFHIMNRFPTDQVETRGQSDLKFFRFLFNMAGSLSVPLRKRRIEELHQRATVHRSFVSDTTERFYFSTAYAVRQSGLLRDGKPDTAILPDARLQVIDLPSIDDSRFRDLTVDTLLELEWKRARRNWHEALKKSAREDERVPTFIVIDEAHNLIPFQTENSSQRWLRERFRKVAAEGRKFGLFLILVSQRPDKLDTIVLSECENKAVMKLGSPSVLAKTVEILGLGEIQKMTQPCLEFDIGRALIVGPWATQATHLYGAARRTEEGGRNLQADYWAQPAPVGVKPVTSGPPGAVQEAKNPESSSEKKLLAKPAASDETTELPPETKAP
jgi:GTPase SAR1 family protein